jgi:hypothetical protein
MIAQGYATDASQAVHLKNSQRANVQLYWRDLFTFLTQQLLDILASGPTLTQADPTAADATQKGQVHEIATRRAVSPKLSVGRCSEYEKPFCRSASAGMTTELEGASEAGNLAPWLSLWRVRAGG